MGLSCIKNKSYHFSLLLRLISFLLILNGLNTFISPVVAASKVHIIYMGERQHHNPDHVTESHHEMLALVLGSKEAAADSMIYSYRHGFSGFAAKLSESQAQEFKGLPGVLHVMPNHFYSLKTTRSWDYLGQSLTSSNNLLHQANMGDGIIVGLIDSGVWPESKGLNDEGLGPIPTRWKGSCKSGDGFDSKIHCNKKLIGAKWFADALLAENKDQFNTTGFREFLSVRDVRGHGTHTATTAAGSMLRNANFKGFMRGMARGGAPRARMAVYKACWNMPNLVPDCNAADMLKAFDEAIHDGVDLLSISIADHVPLRSDVDFRGLNVGSFHAVAKGIPVICAGGNDGPGAQTVANTPPWLLTVAASSMDRLFPTRITLGNNRTIHGESFYSGKEIGFTGLVHPESPKGIIREPRSYCDELSFEDVTVKGKVVLCFSHGSYAQAVSDVKDAGGVGLIVAQNPNSNLAPSNDDDDFPSVLVDFELGTQILFYIRTFRSPVVKIGRAKTLIGDPVATMIAAFSSRGPSSLTPAILKPDIAAPGVNIIAGGSASSSIDGFAIFSGTSMACPHVSGIVALLKAIHPHWSPAAIKSAIVTTATKTDPFGESIFAEEDPRKLATPFDYGGGLVNPNKAANPGLVYDMSIHDYILYLCSQSYDSSSISLLVGLKTSCPLTKPSVLDVNLPSITIPNLKKTVSVTRTVTNVGPVNSKYRVRVDPPIGVSVIVTPNMLVFSESVKSVSFKVTFSTTHQVNNGYYFGSLVWSDGIHVVSIPLSVRTQIIEYLAEY